MPPKIKISKEDIIKTAIELIEKEGMAAVNARSIACELGCSTQPVFSNFAGMEELQQAVIATAYGQYLGFLESEVRTGAYAPYKAFGMAYIRFAKERRELFKLLFMRDRRGESLAPTDDFTASVDMIMQANGVSRQTAERMHMEMWAFVHGIATMLATSFFMPEREMISDMLSDVYQGLLARHKSEEGSK